MYALLLVAALFLGADIAIVCMRSPPPPEIFVNGAKWEVPKGVTHIDFNFRDGSFAWRDPKGHGGGFGIGKLTITEVP